MLFYIRDLFNLNFKAIVILWIKIYVIFCQIEIWKIVMLYSIFEYQSRGFGLIQSILCSSKIFAIVRSYELSRFTIVPSFLVYGSVLLQTEGVVLFKADTDILCLLNASFSGVAPLPVQRPSTTACLTLTEIFEAALAILGQVSFVSPWFQAWPIKQPGLKSGWTCLLWIFLSALVSKTIPQILHFHLPNGAFYRLKFAGQCLFPFFIADLADVIPL